MNLSSRSDVREYLTRHGIAPKKRWGQNFLVDENYRRRIVAVADPQDGDGVWEVGPGLGSLTELLLPRVATLTVFEVDWGLVRHLERHFEGNPALRIVPGDFRKTWQAEGDRFGAPELVLGNLPYRLAATMIGELVEEAISCRRMVFTVQKEVAARITASPGTPEYSSFSVVVQIGAATRRLFDIPPGAFLPVPEVDSSVVEIVPRRTVRYDFMHAVSRVVRTCFAARRKTLRSNLAAAGDDGRLAAAFRAEGVDSGLRAERVAPEVFAAICRRLKDDL